MIGLTIGLIALTGTLGLFSGHLRSNNELLRTTRLNNELRGAMDMIVRDLRRASHWGDAVSGVWYPNIPALLDNPFLAVDTSTAGEVTYRYDVDSNGTVGANETFRIRHNAGDGTIEMQQLSAGGAVSATTPITDEDLTNITALAFAPTDRTATLISAVVILLPMTLIAFFANRNILFERKTAANQYRSTKAIEAAEAGLEWTIANLNSMRRITTSCGTSASTSDRSLRDKYLDPDNNGSFAEPFSTATPLCSFAGGAWSCSCPNDGAQPVAAACSAPEGCPTFRVAFQNMPNDATLVRVTSVGCTNSQAPCVPGADTAADGTATVDQVMKVLSGLATLPAAALTAKGNVNFGANAISVTNTDPGTNGITINAGGSITGFINDSTVNTLPGTPPAASLVGSDTSLSSLSDDQMFKSFFGVTKEQYRDAPSTTVVPCSGVCNSPLQTAISAGARTIWVEGDMTLNANATYGSPERPVILVVNGNAEVRGTITIYGVLYCQDGTWDNTGGGDAQIVGAAIAEGHFTATGTPNPTYDPNVLKRLREATGQVAKVPGGWRDF